MKTVNCLFALTLGLAGCAVGGESEDLDDLDSQEGELTAGPVRLTAAHSGQALSVVGSSMDNGAGVVQMPWTGATSQQWSLKPAAGGVYEIVNLNSGKCLDVHAYSTADGGQINQYRCTGASNQRWRVESVAGGFRIVGVQSDRCLDVAGASREPGAVIQQWGCWGGNNQAFGVNDVVSVDPEARRVLIFNSTKGFSHPSISHAADVLRSLGAENGLTVDATADGAAFTDANLGKYKAVIWLSTTGDVLNEAQQAAFERFIRAGGGYVGVHSASDTEYGWAFYGGLVGAYFSQHPAGILNATIRVEDSGFPATAGLPASWARADEWYNFRSNPRGRVHVLASLDEGTYSGGTMMGDHPISWCQVYEGGRSFYTGAGHTVSSYDEPLFRKHLIQGIRWAAGAVEGDCAP